VKNVANANARDELGLCSILYAIDNFSVKTVNYLIKSGADVGLKSYSTNDTIFHYLISIKHDESKSRFRPMFQTLINAAIKEGKK